MSKPKSLTEKGSLFNNQGNTIRPSTERYAEGMNNFLLVKELKEYVSRFLWDGIPIGLNSNILETMLYYKGQLAFFKVANQYYILPFVYTGQINHYGLQDHLIPISFNGMVENDDRKISHFAGQKRACLYDKDGLDEDKDEIAVVLRGGSSLYLNQTVPPVVVTDEPRKKLVENLIMIRNNIILSQPMKYVNVTSESSAKSIQQQVDTLIYDIMNGAIINTITGTLSFQDINTETSKLQPQQLWQSFASLDSLRMEFLGILNNGVFEKRERNLTDEVAGKQTVSKLLLADDLYHRKMFCTLVNKIFGLNVSVQINPLLIPEDKKEEADNREGGEGHDKVQETVSNVGTL
jgi:hypothetical protein